MVWSPFSNIWLYGDTTDVLSARKHMRVCLGSDWSPSGTRNLLGELKVAALWNHAELAGALSPLELCEMATPRARPCARATGGRAVGRLEPGALADVAVISGTANDPYQSLLAANERNVRLVIVGGEPAYGVGSIMKQAGVIGEAITVAGVAAPVAHASSGRAPSRRARPPCGCEPVVETGRARMEAVRKDPAGEVKKAREEAVLRRRALRVRPRHARVHRRRPREDERRLDDDELDNLVIPPIEPLAHDKAWFDVVDRGHEHAALLRQLRRCSE